MQTKKKLNALFILMLLIILFIAPLGLAIVLYTKNPTWLHNKTLNKGQFISSPVDFYSLKITALNQPPTLSAYSHQHWLLFYLLNSDCETRCQQSLHTIHQVILALGKNSSKVTPALIQVAPSNSAIKKSFIKNNSTLPIYLIASSEYNKFCSKILNKRVCNGYYLVDPKGKITLYYASHIQGEDLYQDLNRLLSSGVG